MKNKEKTLRLTLITGYKVLKKYRVTLYFCLVDNCVYERIIYSLIG